MPGKLGVRSAIPPATEEKDHRRPLISLFPIIRKIGMKKSFPCGVSLYSRTSSGLTFSRANELREKIAKVERTNIFFKIITKK
jgi:hypothetical protein